MMHVNEFFSEMFCDYVMRHERMGRMTESLYERRRANIKAMSALLLATGVTLAWLALKGIAIVGTMAQNINGFVLIITLGVGYLCLWLWLLAVVRLGVAYSHSRQY